MYSVDSTYFLTRGCGLSQPPAINPFPVALDFIEQANPPYFNAFLRNWDDGRLQNASLVTNDPPTPHPADVFFNFGDQPSFPDDVHVNDSHSQEILLPEIRVRAVSSLESATSLVGLDNLGSSRVEDKVQGIDPAIRVILCYTRANLELTQEQLGDYAGIDPYIIDTAEMDIFAIDWLYLKKIVYALLQEVKNWLFVAQFFPHNQGLDENQILDSALKDSKGFNIFTVKQIIDTRTPHIEPSILSWNQVMGDYERLSRVSDPFKISDKEPIRSFLDFGAISNPKKRTRSVAKRRKRNATAVKIDESLPGPFLIPFELLPEINPERVLKMTRFQLQLNQTDLAKLIPLKSTKHIEKAEKKIGTCRPVILKKIVDNLFDIVTNKQIEANQDFLKIKKLIDDHCPYDELQLQMLDILDLSLNGKALSKILLEIKEDKRRGYVIEDLASKIKVEAQAIRRAERGTKIKSEVALNIILHLGIEIERVLTKEYVSC